MRFVRNMISSSVYLEEARLKIPLLKTPLWGKRIRKDWKRRAVGELGKSKWSGGKTKSICSKIYRSGSSKKSKVNWGWRRRRRRQVSKVSKSKVNLWRQELSCDSWEATRRHLVSNTEQMALWPYELQQKISSTSTAWDGNTLTSASQTMATILSLPSACIITTPTHWLFEKFDNEVLVFLS